MRRDNVCNERGCNRGGDDSGKGDSGLEEPAGMELNVAASNGLGGKVAASSFADSLGAEKPSNDGINYLFLSHELMSIEDSNTMVAFIVSEGKRNVW